MFGGGITIENGFFGELGFALKSRFSIQRLYHFGSTALGSYVFGSSGISIQSSEARARLQTPATSCERFHPASPFARERRLAASRQYAELSRYMSDSRPIGVFDSGIGGLTVVKALRDLLPA